MTFSGVHSIEHIVPMHESKNTGTREKGVYVYRFDFDHLGGHSENNPQRAI